MASQINITFNQDLPIGAQFQIAASLTPPGELLAYFHTWQATRTASFVVEQGLPTLTPGERSAMNYVTAFNFDYNNTSQFIVTRNVNVVTIRSNNNHFTFVSGSANDSNSNPLNVNFSVSAVASDLTDFTTAVSANGSNPCDYIDITVQSNVQASKMVLPTIIDPVTSNPFTFTWERGQTIVVKLWKSAINTVSQTLQLPSKLVAANFSVNIVTSPNGATATVNNTNTFGLNLEYSLDGTTFQTSNVFSGLATGSFILFIRDQFGCVISLTFDVPDNGVTVPYFYISKANSIRFASRITFGDSANYKNDENTLSCESQVRLPYKEVQAFQSTDVITTQFKSNYTLNEAVVIREDGSEVMVPIIQKTQNINQTDLRDARMCDLGNGQSGIYFTTGNIYDYANGVAIDTFSLNGALPVWAVSGNYVVISNAWFMIEDVIFDENRNAEIIVIGMSTSGTDQDIIAGSVFNVENYEVYEFTIDFGNYIDETVRVRLESNSPNFIGITYLSEAIQVRTRHANTLEIRYRNETNTDVFYATGITHLIRQEVTRVSAISEDSSENLKTDNAVRLLSSTIFEGKEFTFEPVTEEIMRKMAIALSHETVFIDLVGYVKSEVEHEGPLEDTNLYVVKAKMLKSGFVYNSQGLAGDIYSGGSLQLPSLVNSGDGFVGY